MRATQLRSHWERGRCPARARHCETQRYISHIKNEESEVWEHTACLGKSIFLSVMVEA